MKKGFSEDEKRQRKWDKKHIRIFKKEENIDRSAESKLLTKINEYKPIRKRKQKQKKTITRYLTVLRLKHKRLLIAHKVCNEKRRVKSI